LTFLVDPSDQLGYHRMLTEPKESPRRGKLHDPSKSAWLAQREGNTGRIGETRVIDVDDVEQIDSRFATLIPDHERIAVIPDLIDEVPNKDLHYDKTERGHAQRQDQKHESTATFDRSSQAAEKEKPDESKPNGREYPLVKDSAR